MIQKILPNSDTKLRILKAVYKNPEINYSKLVKKSRTSPNIVLKYVNELVKSNILIEKRLGGKKKTHIRLFKPNFLNLGVDIFSFVELEEKNKFLKKYEKLAPIISQIEGLLLAATKAKFCLIYGSFARFAADKNSDLDLWLVGNISSIIKNRIREIFSTFYGEYSMTIENEKQFLKKTSDSIHQNIIKDHIIIYGEKEFVKLLKEFNQF